MSILPGTKNFMTFHSFDHAVFYSYAQTVWYSAFLVKDHIRKKKKKQPISYPGHFIIKIRNNVRQYLSGDYSFAIFVMKITSAQF